MVDLPITSGSFPRVEGAKRGGGNFGSFRGFPRPRTHLGMAMGLPISCPGGVSWIRKSVAEVDDSIRLGDSEAGFRSEYGASWVNGQDVIG